MVLYCMPFDWTTRKYTGWAAACRVSIAVWGTVPLLFYLCVNKKMNFSDFPFKFIFRVVEPFHRQYRIGCASTGMPLCNRETKDDFVFQSFRIHSVSFHSATHRRNRSTKTKKKTTNIFVTNCVLFENSEIIINLSETNTLSNVKQYRK